MNTHGMVIDFGKFEGTLWTRVPVHYLNWMVNLDPKHSKRKIAEAELKRRQTTMPKIDISGHAIDSASQRCLSIWKQDVNRAKQLGDDFGPGLHKWLVTVAMAAREQDEFETQETGGSVTRVYHYHGMKFVFQEGEFYASLKTVMRKK